MGLCLNRAVVPASAFAGTLPLPRLDPKSSWPGQVVRWTGLTEVYRLKPQT